MSYEITVQIKDEAGNILPAAQFKGYDSAANALAQTNPLAFVEGTTITTDAEGVAAIHHATEWHYFFRALNSSVIIEQIAANAVDLHQAPTASPALDDEILFADKTDSYKLKKCLVSEALGLQEAPTGVVTRNYNGTVQDNVDYVDTDDPSGGANGDTWTKVS